MYDIISENNDYQVLALNEENAEKYAGIYAPIVILNNSDRDITLVIEDYVSEDDKSTMPEYIYIPRDNFINIDYYDGFVENIKTALSNGDYREEN